MTEVIVVSVLIVCAVVLAIMTIQVALHDPKTCRVCVDRRARSRLKENDWLGEYFNGWK
jgi:hypothetical protein